MADQHMQDDRAGSSDHPQHRAGEDEGVRAPFQEDKGPIQSSVFDGAGNEQVVVTTGDAEGNRTQGTGATAEEALADAQNSDEAVGDGFYPEPDLVKDVKNVWKDSLKK
jgi:hypothetical protein